MATFSSNGADSLSASFEQLATLSDDDKYGILDAGAAEYIRAMKDTLQTLGAVASGRLMNSIKGVHKAGKDGPIVRIGPTGSRGKGGGKRKKKNGKSHGSYQGTNAEVGYYLEYGTPRMGARHWMETANEEAESPGVAAMQAAWDKHVTECGL